MEEILAPLAGQVLTIRCAVGDTIEEDDEVEEEVEEEDEDDGFGAGLL